MNKKSSVVVVVSVLALSSGVALADCEQSLDAQRTVECINYEGATSSYLDYRNGEYRGGEEDRQSSEQQQSKSELASMISSD